MTIEERWERKEAKRRHKESLSIKYPGVHFAPRDIQIILQDGYRNSLEIRTNNLSAFKMDPCGGEDGWVRAYIPIDNVSELASLVLALSSRLNGFIEDVNGDIAAISVGEIKSISIGEPKP